MEMKDFNSVLRDIQGRVPEGSVVYTISQRKPNRIVGFTDKVIRVDTMRSEEPQVVKVKWIEDVWGILQKERVICASDLDGKTQGRYRSSFIFALLSTLPYVTSFKKEGIVYITVEEC